MHQAVFCDRDGVINVDYGYVGKIENFELLPGVTEALADLRRKGYLLVLVTNQSGIARGMYTEDDFWQVTDYMQDLLAVDFAVFDAVFMCPHHPEAQAAEYREDCECRKPKPGMILAAAEQMEIDLSKSIVVGDHARDLIAGANAGVGRLVLVGSHLAEEREKLKDLDVAYFADLKAFADSLN